MRNMTGRKLGECIIGLARTAFMIVVATTSATSQRSDEATIRLLLSREQELLDSLATGRKDVWERAMHDSCIIVIEDGSTQTKKKFLDDLRALPPGFVGKIHVIEPWGQVYGNVAILSFIDDETLDLFGQHLHTQYRQTDTWIKSGDEWKMIVMKLFEIPANPLPIPVSSSFLLLYAGVYDISPERKCSVFVRGDSLFAQKTGQQPVSLLAESESIFFRKGDGRVNVLFRMDSTGTMTMIERREGQDLIWRRTKR